MNEKERLEELDRLGQAAREAIDRALESAKESVKSATHLGGLLVKLKTKFTESQNYEWLMALEGMNVDPEKAEKCIKLAEGKVRLETDEHFHDAAFWLHGIEFDYCDEEFEEGDEE